MKLGPIKLKVVPPGALDFQSLREIAVRGLFLFFWKFAYNLPTTILTILIDFLFRKEGGDVKELLYF